MSHEHAAIWAVASDGCTCKSRRKTLNVHFKTVWKYAEIEGNWRKKPAKTGVGGKFRKEAEITGKTDQIFGSGPKGRGFESRHFDSRKR